MLRRKSLQNFIVEYAEAFNLEDLVIEQQYSMRSYETGLYDIRSDGNLRCMINVLNEMPDVFNSISITVPEADQLKNKQLDHEWLRGQIKSRHNIRLLPTMYAENALANRKEGVAYCTRTHGEMVVTYFDIVKRKHTVFLCPGSPRPENPTYSMDEFPWFEQQVLEATATFFLNDNQMIFDAYEDTVFKMVDYVNAQEVDDISDGAYDEFTHIWNIDVYFPYRLTDKDYRFEEFVRGSDKIFGVTDPNHSLEKLPFYEEIKDRVVKLDPARHREYLAIIYDNDLDTKICMPSDLRKTIHMGPVEIFGMFGGDMTRYLFPRDFDDKDIKEIMQEAHEALVRSYKFY